MRLTPVDILANWYNDETLPWSAQKAVNCLAETAEVNGTRSVAKVKGLPGMLEIADLLSGAPIRGAEDVEGTLFVVSGTSLFQINTDFTFINRGNIPGVGLVSMAHNKQGGTLAANELAIANSLSGYVYNTDTTALVQITDDAFPGATTFDYVDGYISFTDPEGRFWGHSALNQATQYNSIDRYDAESAPDKIISHIVSHREVMVFGTRTIEFFRNTGAATGTFQRVDGTEMEVGIAAPLARARLDNTVYWLGSDGLVYRLAGHSPQRVSTRPIEQAISRFNLANAFAHTWEDRGHQVFYLTFPDGHTFGFDVATNLWHARETYGLDRWGINTTTYWNRLWVAGDYSNGKLYQLDWDTYHDNGEPLVMECQPGVTHADQNRVLCPYVELVMDTGIETYPTLTLSGDLPDGYVGDSGTFQYVAAGGIEPYTFLILSGSLPPGATMDANGLVTYDYTESGHFSWTVQVTDAFGNTAHLDDTVSLIDRLWLIGPGGLSNNFYLLLANINNLGSASPTQVPAWLMNGFTYVSGVNGRMFLHGDSTHNAAVSVDGGASWIQCNHNLSVGGATQLQIQYNGTHYYSSTGVRSLDGITWAATPNWPVGTVRSFIARESDGALVGCFANAGLFRTFRSLDNSATAWVETFLTSVGDVQRMATNGSRICAWQAASGGGPSKSDNFWATWTAVSPTVTLGVRPFSLGGNVWLWASTTNVWERNVDGVSTTTVLTGNIGAQAANREGLAGGVLGILKSVSANVFGVWVSNDLGVTFTQATGTFGASAPNFAAIEFIP